jgi:UTP-glucose-1-phosphate uridylyltransferase
MKHTHVAGIIPVAGLKTDFELDTPPILLPVEAGFTAIQKSVYECALAGCQTIWIVANSDLAPIVRKRIGEWVYDPAFEKTSLRGEVVSPPL